jgi:hypothetical protein
MGEDRQGETYENQVEMEKCISHKHYHYYHHYYDMDSSRSIPFSRTRPARSTLVCQRAVQSFTQSQVPRCPPRIWSTVTAYRSGPLTSIVHDRFAASALRRGSLQIITNPLPRGLSLSTDTPIFFYQIELPIVAFIPLRVQQLWCPANPGNTLSLRKLLRLRSL